jgi:tetratricopeptide (TPR) repeat protein
VQSKCDIFLSHNSRDKPAVERIAIKLKRAGLEPWLDNWCLTPGGKWQDELAAGLRASSACAFFVGPNGVGDWASEELNVALDRAAKDRNFRLFLVLLPQVPEPFDATSLPPFLSTRTWIDLRKGIEDPRSFQLLISAIKGVAPGPETPIEARNDLCPYRGLQSFKEEHVDFFFGRNGDIRRLVEKLKATRFLAVIGPSGSGKSSLVCAGLIPKLRAGALTDSAAWIVRVLTPGAHPVTTLAAHLVRLFPQETMHKTLDQMTVDPRTLHLSCSLALAEYPPSKLVVWVIDQFEEVFTLCRDEQERKQFLDNLLYAASIPDGRSAVLLTMRSDFYSRCAAYAELSTRIAAQQFLVSPMDLDGLRQAIEEPAWRVGLEFEQGLVATVLDDVANEPGALPLLEHALLELWERRRGLMMTLEAYRESGGVQGAIARRAEAIYGAFSAEQQETVRCIMMRLTQLGEGTEDTRRRATTTELITNPCQGDAVEVVVRTMADARLLTVGTDQQNGERLVDVAHEALIRSWPRLRIWIDESRTTLRVHRRITEAAQEWQRLNRDQGALFRGARLAQAQEWRDHHEAMLNELEREFLDASIAERRELQRQQRQRQRLLVGALLVFALLAVGASAAAIFGFQQKDKAEKQTRVAIDAEKRTSEVASQAHVSLACDAHEAGKDAEALAHLAKALRLNPKNYGAAAFTGSLLTQASWILPISDPVWHDATVTSAKFSPDWRRVVITSDTGRCGCAIRLPAN